MTVAAAKAAMRADVLARRKIAHGTVDPGPASAALCDLVRRHPGGTTVAAYAPIRTEIDPTPAMETLHAEGYALCLPVVQGPGQALQFRAWRPGMALIPGAFGAPIPEAGPDLSPDVVIAPLLAFDAQGYRLGYGGGFYDRTLAGLRAVKPMAVYGFAYHAQLVPSVPTEPTDVRLDAVVTEAGLSAGG
ncbi:5-formyltetrahydrofolate cyclo-ligase [Oceanibium sediminis]|uniref:5-formyltetrahydrofolate cyclo-ligase n=1 Tax=Oceanibium sediminis TaxID=2026339 RepID=UPI000DD3BA08|nr:5-formyltetrahydrofolate cyclo-ligase [Oceanibium sediminis]